MIHLVLGTDRVRVLEKAHRLIDELARTHDITSRLRYDETGTREEIESLPKARGLFEDRSVILFDRVFGNSDWEEWLSPLIPDFASSENVFVVVEDSLSKKNESLESVAAKVYRFDEAPSKVERFNVFQLADALGRRDKKMLWVLYERALRNGLSAEEIHGTLAWQARMIAAAANTKSADEAGQKPFVFGKAARFKKNYEGHTEQLSRELVAVFHEARRGRFDLELGLEKFILSL